MANSNSKRPDKTEYDLFNPEQRPRSNAAEILPKILVYNGLLLLTVLTNIYIIDPSVRYLFPAVSAAISLLYLPFAVKLMVSFFEGFRAPLYLLPGAIFIDAYFFTGGQITPERLFALMFCYALPPFAFAVTDWLIMSDRRVALTHPRTWRNLYVAGFIASCLCALMMYGTGLKETADMSLRDGVQVLISFIVGDLSGLTVMLMLGLGLIRITQR